MLYVQNQKPFMYIGTTRAGAAAEQFRVFLTGLLQQEQRQHDTKHSIDSPLRTDASRHGRRQDVRCIAAGIRSHRPHHMCWGSSARRAASGCMVLCSWRPLALEWNCTRAVSWNAPQESSDSQSLSSPSTPLPVCKARSTSWCKSDHIQASFGMACGR